MLGSPGMSRTGLPVRCVLLCAAVTAMVACGDGRDPDPTRPADLILFGGTVVTLGSVGSAQAIAVSDGTVLWVGTDEEVLRLRGRATRVVDLDGRTVIPGLGDNHFHSIGGGPGIDLSKARSIADVSTALRTAAEAVPVDQLLYTNSDWHEGQLSEQRLPLRDDLDVAVPDHPLVVVRGGHEFILNSAALERFGLDEGVTDVEGGRIGRYEDGRLNGELVDRAKAAVRIPGPPEPSLSERVEALAAEHRTLNASGLTSVRYAGSTPELFRALQTLEEEDRLTLRVSVLLRPGRDTPVEELEEALEAWGVEPGQGDDWLRVDGVKLGVDGGFEGGWMREPYEEPWGEGGSYAGLQTMQRDHYIAVVRELNRLGWRVATHAVGDAAIDLVLDAYEVADADRPINGRRWVIEHGFIPREDQFTRMRALGLAISAQNHLYLAAPSLVDYWGRDRAEWTTPVRTYVERGVPVSLGTDSPVIPYNPFWVLYHFATRGTISAGAMGASEALDTRTVLELATIGNAHLTFAEGRRGTLDPGMLADFIVLSTNPLAVAPAALEDMRPLMTVVGGRVVWEVAE